MISPPGTARVQQAWGSFDGVRERLFEQFRDVRYDPETGTSVEDLREAVWDHLRAHPDQPRVLQKAEAYRIVVTRGQIGIDPSDWFADKLNHGNILRELTHGSYYDEWLDRGLWLDEALSGPLAEGAAWFARVSEVGLASAPKGALDLGHISPGWENMMSGGLAGLLDKSKRAREALGSRATERQLAFYEAVETVYDASIDLAGRFAGLAARMAPDHHQDRARLGEIASAFDQVPAHRPQTFHQALQFMWFMHELIEMEGENVRSMGHFDRTLYPYYRADIDSGRLTREQAKELIKFFWSKWYARTAGRENGKNFVFAGQYPDGSMLANELTYLALEAYEELNTPDPKLSVRFVPNTPDRLYRRVAELIRNGHNSFVLMNDEPAVAALVGRGKTIEDARSYLPIGCYEPAVEGKEAACTMNAMHNLAKPLELALNDGTDPVSGERVGPRTGDPRRFSSFEQLMGAYTEQLDFALARSARYIRAAEEQWPRINPSPLIAATIDDCLARGMDVGEGGPRYNSVGLTGAGLANAGDSLLAIKRAVYDERRFTIGQVLDALAANFEGHEQMRQYLLNRVPKWGNNDPEADGMARRVADYYCHKVHTFANHRGGACQAGLFSLGFAQQAGKATGALPDGRKAHESLAPGVGSTYGQDKKGVTALVNSVAGLDSTQTPNGAVLDITLHPTAVRGEEGLDAFVSLIKAFFAQGGYAAQFNVVDAETLRDAQRHPERYASLQIRVTGWSVYFTSLSREEQDQFIARAVHGA